jgi:hypothetical protein
MYEDLILGRIDEVVISHPRMDGWVLRNRREDTPSDILVTFSEDHRLPFKNPLTFKQADHRLTFKCTPATGITTDIVRERSKGVKRDPKITGLSTYEVDGYTTVNFYGPQPRLYINEFVRYFGGPADKSEVQRVALEAIVQLPLVVSPRFVIPTMPRYLKPIFGYAKVVTSLIRRDDLKA